MRSFRLLVEDRQDGRWNMAVDHALLGAMEDPEAEPVVRLYGFSPPTLSLGRFQKASEVLDRDALARDGIVVARRPTGGQAVLHDGELTYAVVLSRAHLAVFSKREVYRFVADLLVRALRGAGLSLDVAGERKGDVHNPDCFRTTGEYEISADGRKLVGSAQVVSRAGALQHGSILLDESNRRIRRYLRGGSDAPTEHDSTSVSRLLGRAVDFAGFRAELVRGLEAVATCRADRLRDTEAAAARVELAARYGSESWIFDDQV